MHCLNHGPQRPFTCQRPSRLVSPVIAPACKAQPQRAEGHAESQESSSKISATMIGSVAAAVCFATLTLAPSPVMADTYSQRAEAMQKRKEMLQQTREKALARGGVESSSEPAPPPVEDAASVTEPEPSKNDPLASEIESIAPSPANTSPSATEQAQKEKQAAAMRESLKASRKAYEDESARESNKLQPGREAEKNPQWFKSFLNKGEAPAPQEGGPAAKFVPQDVQESQNAPAVPAPPSKEVTTPKKQPIEQDITPGKMASSVVDPLAPEGPIAKRAEKYSAKPSTPKALESAQTPIAAKETSKKRRGPLPMWLAQVLLLASYGGIGYAVFFKEQEVNAVLSVGAKSVVSAYGNVQKKVSKK